MIKATSFGIFNLHEANINIYSEPDKPGAELRPNCREVTMRTRLKLKPGQRGTKKLLDLYGDTLLCVRYRYDEENGLRLKTAEIIVERQAWTPSAPKVAAKQLVTVKIEYAETAHREMVKAAGGKWDADAKVWRVPYANIKGTELEKHITVDATPPSEATKGI